MKLSSSNTSSVSCARPKMMILSLRYGKQLQRRRQLRAELPESVWKSGEDHRDEEVEVGEEEEEEDPDGDGRGGDHGGTRRRNGAG